MKLYSYFRSSCSYRLRIALNIKGIEYDIEGVPLLDDAQNSEEYKKLNPQGLVPTLIDEDITVSQSLAALEYLEEKYPEPALLPSDLNGKARVRSLALAIACDIQPLNNLRILKYITGELGASDEQKSKWSQDWTYKGFDAIEKMLESEDTGKFCHGDIPTFADICLVPQAYNANRVGCDLSKYPNIVRICEECNNLPEFEKAKPENQHDAF